MARYERKCDCGRPMVAGAIACSTCYEGARERRFADPGGRSALRAASRCNPRNLPCPSCGEPDRLTPRDRSLGYQCDACADRDERGF